MGIKWRDFQLPKRLECEESSYTATYGKFSAAPFERGYGVTLGNSLRRVLLSSIEGSAVTSIKILGISHEFSAIPGVLEDVPELILNIKTLVLNSHSKIPKTITIKANSKGEIRAKDIQVDETVEIISDYKKFTGMSIVLIKVEDALPGKGRNIGISIAKYDIIALTDGGIILDINWLKNLAESFESDQCVEVVYGSYDFLAKTLFEECFAIVYMPIINMETNKKRVIYPFLASSMFKKYVWEKAGKFREDLRATEDTIFFREIEKLKFNSAIQLNAIAHWRPRSNLTEAFTLALKYAECDAVSSFHILRYVKKYFIYLLGLCFIGLGFVSSGWFAVLLLGFIANMLLVCSKNWRIFLRLLRSDPISIFIVLSIILVLDIGGIIGFTNGIFKKNRNRF